MRSTGPKPHSGILMSSVVVFNKSIVLSGTRGCHSFTRLRMGSQMTENIFFVLEIPGCMPV